MIKTKSWGGVQNLRNLGRKVAAATISDYLENLDLWVIILWATDCLNKMHLMNCSSCLDFSNVSSVYLWSLMIVQFGESGNRDLQVQITLLRPENEFHYYLCLQVDKIFGHHRIGAYGKQKYPSVPHSRAFSHFSCNLGLCPIPYKFVYMPFLLNFDSGSSIP